MERAKPAPSHSCSMARILHGARVGCLDAWCHVYLEQLEASCSGHASSGVRLITPYEYQPFVSKNFYKATPYWHW